MDPLQNPYSPGAGSPPPELVGRDPILEQSRILLGRIKLKRPEKSMLLTGLRGVGKTVLLNEIARQAKKEDYLTVSVEAHEANALGPLIVPHLRSLLYELNRLEGVKHKVKRALAVLRGFVGSLKIKVDDASFGLDIEPETGTADSGNLSVDLPNLFIAIGEAAADRKKAIAILIDEIQYFDTTELGALIMAMHRVQQQLLPIVLIGAGLPILPELAGESKSYAERLFNFPDIGALSAEDAAKALRDPAKAVAVQFEPDALDEVYRLTRGYPYFVQEWGYVAWNTANANPITKDVVIRATPKVIANLDKNFFRVRFDRLTQSEKLLLQAMAILGPGPHRTGDVAEALHITVRGMGPRRAKLIQKGMIYSPAHGEMAFTVPLFDEFMLRAMPA